ncbi:MAG: hypothetical protein WCE21_04870 [Candidatus Babeliales bacterium]
MKYNSVLRIFLFFTISHIYSNPHALQLGCFTRIHPLDKHSPSLIERSTIIFGQTGHSIEHNTNFDWEYYVTHNNLVGIETEEEAYEHYINYGKAQNLPYCKSFNMLIVMHLFEMPLIDWLIDKTNNFIKNNPSNSYAIKITIPVDTNIKKFNPLHATSIEIPKKIIGSVRRLAPYHKKVVNRKNAPVLYKIAHYLYNRLNIPKEKIQIIFCENRGVDIGGFFLALDQIVKQQQPHDFLVKFHSKADEEWRIGLTPFLDLRVNKILNYYGCMYSSNLKYPDHCNDPRHLERLRKMFGLEDVSEFNFAIGTMFIVSSQFTQFVSNWDFIKNFNLLNKGHNYGYEPYFERLFGCIFHKLKLASYYFADFPATPIIPPHSTALSSFIV